MPCLFRACAEVPGGRTWRLALAFFGGVGGALLILDCLAVAHSQDPSPVALASDARPVLIAMMYAWPITHAVIFALLAYRPVWQPRLPACRPESGGMMQNLLVMLAATVVYGAGVACSLAGRGLR